MNNLIALFLVLVMLLSFFTINIEARSLADVEKEQYIKPGPGPMDKAPEIISLKQGDLVKRQESKYISLDGEWLITDKGFNGFDNSYKVMIPSSLSYGLFKAGVIENPYVGKNDLYARTLGERTWHLKKTFTYKGEKENVILNFKGVADRCIVHLNGQKITNHQGMFGGPTVDVTDKIRIGENELIVSLSPFIDFNHTVVFNCSYGWHYGLIPPIGIWDSVQLIDKGTIEFDSPFIATHSYEKGTLDLSVDILALKSNAFMSGQLIGTIKPKNFLGKAYSFTYDLKTSNARLRFDMPEFDLWWPNGYGLQNLYTLELSFESDSGEIIYYQSSFGIRELELKPFPQGEKANMYNRLVSINGRDLFMKGAGWCTIDALMRFEREDYDRILSRAKEQGLNFFRAWGGGMPEVDAFYDLCDEYGIAVYQEWPSCWDSHDRQPIDVFSETVILNTKRIRNHPSLIIYGGGNEGIGDFSSANLNTIGRLTYEYDGTRTFYRQDGGPSAAGMAHDHIHWGGQSPEHYITAYAHAKNTNLHEYGLDSMMNLESIAKYATEKEMKEWPIDPNGTIAHHTATFNGTTGWNPTPYGYDIDTYIHYASDFLEVNSLADLVLGSQLAQTMADYLAMQNARILFPDVTAIAYYKLNDVFPGGSWATVDWYGVPKIAHYFIKNANRTLMATGHFDRYNTYDKQDRDLNLPIYILYDNLDLDNSTWSVHVKAYDRFLKLVKEDKFEGKGSIGTNTKVGDFYLSEDQADSSPLFIVIDLIKNNEEPIRSYTFMNYDRVQGSLFHLPRTTLEYELVGKAIRIKNTGNLPAVAVNLLVPSVSDTIVCEDNYFWLEAGEERIIDLSFTDGFEGVDAFNLADTSDKKAPDAPKSLKAQSYADSIDLSWKAAKDDKKLLGYFIYVNDELYDFVNGKKTSASLKGFKEMTEYDIKVIAVDYNMNESKEATISVTTKADLVPARVDYLEIIDENTINIKYSKEMDKESAQNSDYYTFNYDVKIEEITLASDLRTLTIKASNLDFLSGKTYSLIIMGAKDGTYTGNSTLRHKFALEPDLKGYWDFNEGEGNLVYDRSGAYKDPAASFKANWTEGIEGYALDIEGLGGLKVGITDLYVSSGTSLSFWVKGQDLKGYGVMVAKGAKEAGHFEIYSKDGQLLTYSPDIGDIDLKVNISEYIGKWTHLAFVINSNQIQTYINGELVSTTKIQRFKDIEGLLSIGTLNDGSLSFGGAIDDFRIYTKELSKEDIKKLMQKDDMLLKDNFLKINLEEEFLLEVEFIGKEGKKVIWESSNPEVATIEDGKITGLEYGQTIITVRTEDGEFIDKCFVQVGDFKKGIDPLILTLIICGAFLILVLVVALIIKKKKK